VTPYNNHIICGKLDNRTDLGAFSARAAIKVRLDAGSTATGKLLESLPVSIGKNGIWFDGKEWKPETFLSMAATKGIKRLLVLTNREHLQIVERAAAHRLRVDVFETIFPVLSDIKYSSCSRTNHDVLKKLLRKLDQLGIRYFNFSKEMAHGYLRATVNKIRFKNGYDHHFFFAYKDGYQEVFKLKEERADRVIIAFDFNSMYLEPLAKLRSGKRCGAPVVSLKPFFGGET